MSYLRLLGTFFVSLLLSTSVCAIDFDHLDIIARANFRDGYQLPPGTYLTNMGPVFNDRGDIAFQVVHNGRNQSQSLWYRRASEKVGSIVHSAPRDLRIGDVDLSEKGKVLFGHFDFAHSEGIFSYHPQNGVSHTVNAKDYPGYDSFSRPQVLPNGEVLSRTIDKNNIRRLSLFSPLSSQENLLEVEGDGLSYLFSPEVAGPFVAIKVRHGKLRDWSESNPDEIRRYQLEEGHQTIAVDQDHSPDSPYVEFHNTVGVSSRGHVVFVATLEDQNQALFMYAPENSEVHRVAKEGVDVQEIEYFPSRVNSLGHVAFRAKDKRGKRSIYLGLPRAQGFEVEKLLSEGDLVPTDRETGRVVGGGEAPGFSGSLDINNNSEILLHAIIESKRGEKHLGAAVYKLNYSNLLKTQ